MANRKILNIAHRGARSLAPENTLAAARKAFALGADMWELDVALTADMVLVVLHDDTLERTSNAPQVYPDRAPWNVHDFTLAELRRLDFGSWFLAQDPFGQVAAGHISAAEKKAYSGAQIPTLREALDITMQVEKRVNVEIKDHTGSAGDTRVVEDVVALIEQLGMTAQVLISSFNHSYLTRSRTANKSIATGALVETPIEDPLALLEKTGAQAYNPYLALITPQQIRELRAAKRDVYVWTVNEEVDMQGFIVAGVSGIITDFPQRLCPLLERL